MQSWPWVLEVLRVSVSEKPQATLPAIYPTRGIFKMQAPYKRLLVKNCQLDCRWEGGGWDKWGGCAGGGCVGGGCEVTKLSGMPVPVHAVLLKWWANYQQTKPCRLLGGFSGEAGEITIVTGDEVLPSDSPVGKDNSQRGAIRCKMLHCKSFTQREREGKAWLVAISLWQPAPKAWNTLKLKVYN